jgi:hypothetical protein
MNTRAFSPFKKWGFSCSWLIIGDGLTGRLRDDAFKGLADKALIRNTLTSRAGFHGLK